MKCWGFALRGIFLNGIGSNNFTTPVDVPFSNPIPSG
jgi:hypothetical protein